MRPASIALAARGPAAGKDAHRARTYRSAWLAAALAGCGGGGGSAHDADAGTDGGPDGWTIAPPAAPAPPEAPAAVAPPQMTCPDGWRAVADASDASVSICDPWPEGGPAACAADEAWFPGAGACERIGPACPAGLFADDLPAGIATTYVDAAAAPGGDGSLAAPFDTISAALAVAEDDSVVALASGTYDEAPTIDAPVTLWGACVAETVLAPSAPSEVDPTVRFQGRGGGALRNVTIASARTGVAVSAVADPALLDAVTIRGAAGRGVLVEAGGTATVTDLVVVGTEAFPSDGDRGYAVEAKDGGVLAVSRAVLTGGRSVGAIALVGASLSLADVAISDTRPREYDGHLGFGADAVGGGSVTLDRVVIERARGVGLIASDPGSSIQATDLLVRDVESLAYNDLGGQGLLVEGGASATLERVALVRARATGVEVDGAGSDLDATDLVVADTREEEGSRLYGRGLSAGDGAYARILRAALHRNLSGTIHASGGASIDAFDVAARDTAPAPADPVTATGLDVSGGSIVTLRRGLFERIEPIGIFATDPGSRFDGFDVQCLDPVARADGTGGECVIVVGGAAVTIERGLIARGSTAGVLMDVDTTFVGTDLRVQGIRASPATGLGGDGMDVAAGATATLTRASFEDCDTAGIFALGALVATDLSVTDTRAEPSTRQWGRGLELGGAATATLTRAAFERNVSEGIAVLDASTLDAQDLVVQGTSSRPLDGNVGEGLVVARDSVVTIARTAISSNRRVGILATDDARISLEDADIGGTLAADCGEGCRGGPGGNGLDAIRGGAIVATRFRASRNSLCGIQIALDGEADLHDGEVSDNLVGVNVSIDGYDLARVQNGVVFRDNGTNLDSTTLPIPDVVGSSR